MNKYLNEHLNKYPLMQIEDKIKLIMQGNLGPGHLVNNYQMVLTRVSKELEELSNTNQEMIEEISDSYVRIYLAPYYAKYHNFDNLINIFIKSSQEEKDYTNFFNDLKKLRNTLNEEDKKFLDMYLENKDYLISHSKTYRDIYNPHYLVIHKKYL